MNVPRVVHEAFLSVVDLRKVKLNTLWSRRCVLNHMIPFLKGFCWKSEGRQEASGLPATRDCFSTSLELECLWEHGP